MINCRIIILLLLRKSLRIERTLFDQITQFNYSVNALLVTRYVFDLD